MNIPQGKVQPYGYRHRPSWKAADAVRRPPVERSAPPAVPDISELRKMGNVDLSRLLSRVKVVMLERQADDTPVRLGDKALPRAVARIITVAADDAGLTVGDILGQSRVCRVVEARHRVMASIYALKLEDGRHRFSQPTIGRMMGRDSSTVSHAISHYEGPLVEAGTI